VKGADEVGAQALVEICLAHSMHGAKADVPDTMGQCGGSNLARFGDIENLPRPSDRRAIGNNHKVTTADEFAEDTIKADRLPTGQYQRPAFGRQPARDGLTEPARCASDKGDSLHVRTSVSNSVEMRNLAEDHECPGRTVRSRS
jgi:hypothetical protein